MTHWLEPKFLRLNHSRLVWAVGGFTLSLGLGAWAVAGAANPIQTSVMTQNDIQFIQPAAVTSTLSMPSNTRKVVESVHTTIYEAPKVAVAPASQAAQSTVKTVTTTKPAATTIVAAQPVTKKANTPAKAAAPQRTVAPAKPSNDGVFTHFLIIHNRLQLKMPASLQCKSTMLN